MRNSLESRTKFDNDESLRKEERYRNWETGVNWDSFPDDGPQEREPEPSWEEREAMKARQRERDREFNARYLESLEKGLPGCSF